MYLKWSKACDCCVQGSSIFYSWRNNEKRSIKWWKFQYNFNLRATGRNHGSWRSGVRKWSHSFLSCFTLLTDNSLWFFLCWKAYAIAETVQMATLQGLKIELESLKEKGHFSANVCLSAAEVWFHFLQKEARGKSRVCFLSQFEHVQPSEPNRDSCLRFDSVWAWGRSSCFQLLPFACDLTWVGNPGCVCGEPIPFLFLAGIQETGQMLTKWVEEQSLLKTLE